MGVIHIYDYLLISTCGYKKNKKAINAIKGVSLMGMIQSVFTSKVELPFMGGLVFLLGKLFQISLYYLK